MTEPLLAAALWARIEPLLPEPKPRRFRHPGRKRIDDRRAFVGILFVLKTGIPWDDLPRNWPSTARCGRPPPPTSGRSWADQ